MKHSDYMKITWGLEHLMNSREFGIETLRVLFATVEVPAEPETLMPGERAIRRVPTDDAREHPFFQHRYQLLGSAEKIVEETADLICCCTDEWMETNQDRADQRMKPTVHTMSLIPLMSNFLTATSTPIPGCVGLYDKVRILCREWVYHANKWFPEILANQGGETKTAPQESEPASTTIAGRVDREKMGGFFNGGFKIEDSATKMVPFNKFCNRLDTGGWNATDIGRIAFQVKQSKWVLRKYRDMPFSRFARLFFDACGVPVPRDISPRTYKKIPDKADMQDWLK